MYVLDTNIITAILRGNARVKERIQKAVIEGKEILINGISYYEIKRGLLAKEAVSQLDRFDILCEKFGLVLLDTESIFDEAAQIYSDLKRRGELIEDADILIASIAKVRDLVLVSDDTDFQRIQNLRIENWLA